MDPNNNTNNTNSNEYPPYPSIGVSIEFIKYFIQFYSLNNQITITTTEICELIIKPQTKDLNLSYVDYLLSTTNTLTNQTNNSIYFGTATYFISHAWKFSILQLFSSIEIFHNSLLKEERDSGKVFYWIDLFVIDQHNAVNRPHNWWSTVFIDAIRNFHNVVLVFIPFIDPIPLHRAWCLWELYSSIIVNANIHITMPAEQWLEFRIKIQNDYSIVGEIIKSLDVHLAEAFNPKDRDEIFETIQSTCGFDHINTVIRKKILGIVLCGAVRETIKDHNIDRVKYFLNAGGDIDTIATFFTPLGIVAELNDLELLQLLITNGANINKIMTDGNTALHLAARNGHVDICAALLKEGANSTIRNNAGRTPLEETQDVLSQQKSNNNNAEGTSEGTNQQQSTTSSLSTNSSTILDELKRKAIASSENAMTELNHLKKSEFSELKAMPNPPSLVVLVFQFLSLFLGLLNQKEKWNRIMGTVVLRASIIADTVSYLNRIMNNEVQLSPKLYQEFKESELYSLTQQQYEWLPVVLKGFHLSLCSTVFWYEYYQLLSTQTGGIVSAESLNTNDNNNNNDNKVANDIKQENTEMLSNEMINFNFLSLYSKETSQNNELLYLNCRRCVSLLTEPTKEVST